MIKSLFNLFLLMGSEWVLWVLAICSFVSMAVIIERRKNLVTQERIGQRLWKDQLEKWFTEGPSKNWQADSSELSLQYPCVETRLLSALSKNNQISSDKVEKISHSFLLFERMELERYLAVLGTLGNSAPFIGLFGTVLGIIRAFSELGKSTGDSGLASVSGGLSEALVTTAAGLLVAIPSAVAFNYYQRKIKAISSRTLSLSGLIAGCQGEVSNVNAK